jgi:hypothetical protein
MGRYFLGIREYFRHHYSSEHSNWFLERTNHETPTGTLDIQPEQVSMAGSRRAGRHLVGTNWLTVSIADSVQHQTSLEHCIPRTAPAHAQALTNRRSARLFTRPFTSAPQENALTSSTNSTDSINSNKPIRTIAYTNLWATFLKEICENCYQARFGQRA